MSKLTVYISSLSSAPYTLMIRTKANTLYPIDVPPYAQNKEVTLNDDFEYNGFLVTISRYTDSGVLIVRDQNDKKIVKFLEKNEAEYIKNEDQKRDEDMKKIDIPINNALNSSVRKDMGNDGIITKIINPDGETVHTSEDKKGKK